jgi:hypothetical protein
VGLLGMDNFPIIVILCILSVFQPTRQRLVCAMVFAFSCAIHSLASEAWLPKTSDSACMAYYWTAMIIDSVILLGITIFARATRFIDFLFVVVLCCTALNFYGLIIYDGGDKPDSYNTAFSILYIITACIFMGKDTENESTRLGRVLLPLRQCYRLCLSLRGET